MNTNIFEAIKSDNIDLFRLLFEYRRLFDSITNFDEYKQIIQETSYSCICLAYHTGSKNLFVKEIKEYLRQNNKVYNKENTIIACTDEFYRHNKYTFKYLFDPILFLDLCIKYNSVNIYKDYIDTIMLYQFAMETYISLKFYIQMCKYDENKISLKNKSRLDFIYKFSDKQYHFKTTYPEIYNEN